MKIIMRKVSELTPYDKNAKTHDKTHKRIHHNVHWRNCAACILNEKYRKAR